MLLCDYTITKICTVFALCCTDYSRKETVLMEEKTVFWLIYEQLPPSLALLRYYVSHLKGTVARNFFLNWDCGVLDPSDVMHPLLTSVHHTINLLRSFKDGAHRCKTYFIILSDTHALWSCECVSETHRKTISCRGT